MYTDAMQWKTIKNYNNYEVSDTGLIRNKNTLHILKPTIKKQRSRYGYAMVYLYKGNQKRNAKMVHRLVAEAFIPNTKNLPQINHKDENSLNNNAYNLEWCTPKYNMNYGTLGERRRDWLSKNNPWKGKKHSQESIEKMRIKKLGQPSKRKRKIVIEGIEYESIKDAMTKLRLSTRALYKKIKKEGDIYV